MPRSARRHDRDAGRPADVLAAKAALREEVWSAMRAAKVARFPGAAGRIPNLVDFVITPNRVIDARKKAPPRPQAGIQWADLTDEKIAAIPLLRTLKNERS